MESMQSTATAKKMKRKAGHSRALLGACVAGGYRKENRQGGGSSHDRFSFCLFVPLEMCGNVFLYVEYRGRTT